MDELSTKYINYVLIFPSDFCCKIYFSTTTNPSLHPRMMGWQLVILWNAAQTYFLFNLIRPRHWWKLLLYSKRGVKRRCCGVCTRRHLGFRYIEFRKKKKGKTHFFEIRYFILANDPPPQPSLFEGDGEMQISEFRSAGIIISNIINYKTL